MLINKREIESLKNLNCFKAFIEYSNNMDDLYKHIEEYKRNKKCKMLIAFDYRIGDKLSNKKLNPIITELFIKDRKLDFSLLFMKQSYFSLPKNI